MPSFSGQLAQAPKCTHQQKSRGTIEASQLCLEINMQELFFLNHQERAYSKCFPSVSQTTELEAHCRPIVSDLSRGRGGGGGGGESWEWRRRRRRGRLESCWSLCGKWQLGECTKRKERWQRHRVSCIFPAIWGIHLKFSTITPK